MASPLKERSTVKDPPLSNYKTYVQCYGAIFIRETSIRYRCTKCGRFVNPGFEEVFKEHTHCGQ